MLFRTLLLGYGELPEYETDSFERILSSPSPLAGDPDPVQSGLVDQKSIQSSPIRLVRTVQFFIVLTLGRFPYFATFASGGGGGGTTPPGDRPLMVVELRGKNQSTRLDETSRLHILFLVVLGQHLT